MSMVYSGDTIQDTDGGVLRPISSVHRNRIINGQMTIDQRNAGASVTPDGSYTLDRWRTFNTQTSKFTVQQNAGSVTPPSGFTNYLGVTSSSAFSVGASDYFSVAQAVEGFNTADLGWGTASAKTITLSFWVRSSLTGAFGGTIVNSAFNRNYIFSYTISSADTWEQKYITIAGDTSGTWLSNSSAGLWVLLTFGAGASRVGTAGSWGGTYVPAPTGATSVVGTSGATFYITGVQLEVGTSATGFEYRQYGQELALCQRYLPVWYGGGDQIVTMYNSDTGILGSFKTPVPVRSAITGLTFSTTANSIFSAYDGFKGGYSPTNGAFNSGGINYVTVQCNSTSLGTGRAGLLRVSDNQWMYGTGCEL